jgi:hypothetical protein
MRHRYEDNGPLPSGVSAFRAENELRRPRRARQLALPFAGYPPDQLVGQGGSDNLQARGTGSESCQYAGRSERACPFCDTRFTGPPRQIWCSHRCRQKAYRLRRKMADIADSLWTWLDILEGGG